MGHMKKMIDIASIVEEESLGYFLTGYASPDIIADDAESEALRFRELWAEALPLLEELQSLVDDARATR